MKIYLATWLLEIAQGEALSKTNAIKRLVSYYHSKDKSSEEFSKYCKTGRNNKK
ncbi:MAG: hypothetical protein UR73_C0013G0007 [candidate division WS6 bacterium GW2011_GWF1_35_23]|uniref:Uncharacterized protein n=1 Tax=candidate division WS6 bacterium GW2011_GWF1_35_23 TaxID=1619097 RepID=A0A0G0C7M8_9BACT|nr:MAG: hypothetical protein UR73_C0013G0007 [candidate division WS6 bacterium GW2011_GWF1_35_23]